MSEELVFLMGKYPAHLPADRRYCRNHMWCQPLTPPPLPQGGRGEGRLRFGFTAYAVRLMQDVYFLDWVVSAGDVVQLKQQIGHIETSKAVADLFAPIAGTLVDFNRELLKDPSAVNVDTYGAGWLFEMECGPETLLDVTAYHQHLADNWEKTQRLIKGKINTED